MMVREVLAAAPRLGLILIGLAFLAGCDRDKPGLTPADLPPPQVTVPEPAQGVPIPVGGIVLILPRQSNDMLVIWEQAARAEAGLEHTVLEVVRPNASDPPARQAELIRQASSGQAAALIVVPERNESVAAALAEVRDRGLPILLLGRSITVPGKPIPLVAYPPADQSARQIVTAAVADARERGFTLSDPAVILADTHEQEQAAERVDALAAALRTAGVRNVEIIRFGEGVKGPNNEDATAALKDLMARRKRLAIVLADDQVGLLDALTVRDLLDEKDWFTVAGYTYNTRMPGFGRASDLAAGLEINIKGAARQAVRTALQLTRHEPVPDRIEVSHAVRAERKPGAK